MTTGRINQVANHYFATPQQLVPTRSPPAEQPWLRALVSLHACNPGQELGSRPSCDWHSPHTPTPAPRGRAVSPPPIRFPTESWIRFPGSGIPMSSCCCSTVRRNRWTPHFAPAQSSTQLNGEENRHLSATPQLGPVRLTKVCSHDSQTLPHFAPPIGFGTATPQPTDALAAPIGLLALQATSRPASPV